MDNIDIQVLKAAVEWTRQGHRAVLGTIVRTWGSAPRPVGSNVVIRDDGLVTGSVSGGCIEDDLIARVRARGIAAELPELIRYGVSAEEATRFGLPCGGTIELLLEPVMAHSRLPELLARLEAGRATRRIVARATGEVTLEDADGTDELQLDDDRLVAVFGPSWRMLLIGAGQLSQYLAEMAGSLGYQVTVCDPREEYADTWPAGAGTLVRTMPDDTVIAFAPDRHTAIIALTHDPKLDDMALLEALRSQAFYVGAIGSYANQRKRRERLIEHFEMTAEELDRLHGPVGLKNGARTPPEIAVSILAELTAVRYGYRIPAPVKVEGAPAAVEAGCTVG
jgi:xanthine dehydrogenase accessory factor